MKAARLHRYDESIPQEEPVMAGNEPEYPERPL